MSVESVYNAYQGERGRRIADLRKLVLEVAASTPGVGEITECLKWGQPSFVTAKPKTGSTIRVDVVKDSESAYAMYFICNTNLVDRFREQYPDTFRFEGNRAILFDVGEPVPESELRHCIAMALTYHLEKA